MWAGGLVVVGSGPAGIQAAVTYREHSDHQVVVVSADPDAPYERPPLSKGFLRGDADEPTLLLHDARFYEDRDIDLVLSTSVAALDPGSRTITLADGKPMRFEACVLATGSQPRTLPIPGADHPAVLTLRSLNDGRLLRAAAAGAESATVIGSGFIGCEAAASLSRRGLAVTLITNEPDPQTARLGPEVARLLREWLSEEGVRLRTDVEVAAIEEARQVRIQGEEVSTRSDIVLMATGIAPEAYLARDAGLAVNNGRILADAHLRTSVPDVFVAGDVALATHAIRGRRLPVEHWGDALAMGEVAGRNVAGHDETWSEIPGFWTTIGERTAKYASWGDGFDEVRLVQRDIGQFTAWYGRSDRIVGVFTVDADDDYEQGRKFIEQGQRLSELGR